MKKVILFGTGKHYENHKRLMEADWEIIAFADNNTSKQGKEYEGKPIVAPETLKKTEIYDYVVIASTMKHEIIRQLLDMGISVDKIRLLNCYYLADPSKVDTCVLPSGEVDCRIEGISFTCRTKSDFNVAQDIFDSGNYNFRDNTGKQVTVIDVGMNIGLASLYFANKENVIEVYAFEPFQETYEQAVGNIEKNDSSITRKIHMFPFGLGKENERKYFQYNAAFSEVAATVGAGETEGTEGTVPVEIRKASEILDPVLSGRERKDNNSIILKMDCQGSEYEIMEDLDQAGLLSRVDIFLIEWHSLNKNSILENLLQKHGYSYLLFSDNGASGLLYGFR